MRRDFAFLVDISVPADTVLRAARGAERNLITGVSLFDVYDGDKLPAGKKSLAIEVVFQPRERTLTDAEIDAALRRRSSPRWRKRPAPACAADRTAKIHYLIP